MDNMFDSLRWSNSWDSPIGGPQMVNGWDYGSMQNWAGIPQADEYFDVGFPEDPNQLGYDLEMQTSNPADIMNGHYGQMEHRQSR